MVRHGHQLVNLTTVEFDLLETLMRAAGQVVNREKLTRDILGREFSPFDRSIDTQQLVPLSEKIGKHPYLRLLVITLLAVALCFGLTLHITRPLGKLRQAASDIADGRLKTRVKPGDRTPPR